MINADKNWYRACALAVANILRLHDQPVIAKDLYNSLSLSKKVMRDADVAPEDIEVMKNGFGADWNRMS
jgi:hypothetical protein